MTRTATPPAIAAKSGQGGVLWAAGHPPGQAMEAEGRGLTEVGLRATWAGQEDRVPCAASPRLLAPTVVSA